MPVLKGFSIERWILMLYKPSCCQFIDRIVIKPRQLIKLPSILLTMLITYTNKSHQVEVCFGETWRTKTWSYNRRTASYWSSFNYWCSMAWIGCPWSNVSRFPRQSANELVYRDKESTLKIIDKGRAWSFDSDGHLLRLASEAHRIHLAYLFDPLLAVHTSLLEPLPHQITGVYGEMLPRQPLRFLLAEKQLNEFVKTLI